MSCPRVSDASFLATLADWLREKREILVLIRFNRAAGSKDFEFFSSFEDLSCRLRQLPSLAHVTAFRQTQLPFRGVVDDEMISRCLNGIPDGSEYLLIETIQRKFDWGSYWHDRAGESIAELREALEDSRGNQVAVGLYPPCFEENEDVIFAVVPDEHGATSGGVY